KNSNDNRHLQMQSTLLHDENHRCCGAIIILSDVTKLRRLQAVRRDFVANVSHELKTPISVIKAASETLGDETEPDAESALRFRKIIVRQANRLDAIVKDLLSLARIEQAQENDNGVVAWAIEPVKPIINHAVETCQVAAAAKNITVGICVNEHLRAKINESLLEQALINLVDNAIKYSPPDTKFLIEAKQRDRQIIICVKDQGRGIESEHLPRVFERFYRTDKARSRSLGGTGLGLAIVKHVAEIHGGRVSLDSAIGQGSSFCIDLPAI